MRLISAPAIFLSFRLLKHSFLIFLLTSALVVVLPLIVNRICVDCSISSRFYEQRLILASADLTSSPSSSSSSDTKLATNDSTYLHLTNRCANKLSRFLNGRINVTFEAPSFDEISERNPSLERGGQFRPKSECVTNIKERLAIVIPYRNRENQLRALLNHLHPILQRQQLDYTIFVVEQANNETYNKALLMNAAFKESSKLASASNDSRQFECYIFHDVDLFLEDDRGLHLCGGRPIHLSEYIDKFDYQPWGGTDVLFGGVVAITRRIFELVNGYSNIFFGWGGEDEEMRMRLRLYNIPIMTPNAMTYRYKMIKHGPDVGNPWNDKGYELIRKTQQRMYTDGLNSARYNLIATDFFPTHTRFLINFTRQEIYRQIFGDDNSQN